MVWVVQLHKFHELSTERLWTVRILQRLLSWRFARIQGIRSPFHAPYVKSESLHVSLPMNDYQFHEIINSKNSVGNHELHCEKMLLGDKEDV